jgi:DNA-binding response OmpR family regulator
MQGSSKESIVLSDGDSGRGNRTTIGQLGDKRPVVLISGDSHGLPLELGGLLRDCGCSAFVTTNLQILKETAHADPDVIVVNFEDIKNANPEREPALREHHRKAVVCLLPYPEEHQIAQVATLGADVIIFKPLNAEEFKSRIRLLLWERRNHTRHPSVDLGRSGPSLQISKREKVAVRNGELLHLTPKEHALLSLLAANPGRVFSSDEIIQLVWPNSRRATAADVHQCIYSLRKKVEKDPRNPQYIRKDVSRGYKIQV